MTAMEGPSTPLGPGDFVTPTLRLVRSIGSGGMGSVWLADHLTLHTQVVVKFLAAAMVGDDVLRTRFSHEAAAASQVKSPHVVQMIDHGVTPNGVPFIAMEHLEGETLSAHLRREKLLAPHIVVAIISQICKALTRAHDRGIVHRDIKPDNIFLVDAHQGEVFVKVLDFGIAKRAEHEEGSTQTGQALGTPSFMSPEQTVGSKDVDGRSDLWSLGVLAFLLLTGTKSFAGGSIGAVAVAVHTKDHPKPTERNPSLPPAIDGWFARACAVEAEDRIQTARELADSLAEALGVSNTGPRSIATEAVSFTKLKLEPDAPQDTNHGPIAQSITPGETLPAPAPRRRGVFVLAGVAALALIAGLVAFRSGSSDSPKTGPAARSSEPAAALPVPAMSSAAPSQTTSPPPASTPSASTVSSVAPGAQPVTKGAATAKPGAAKPTTPGKPSYDDIE